MLPKLILALQNLPKEEWSLYSKYLLMHTSESTDAYLIFSKLRKARLQLSSFDTVKWRIKYMPNQSEKAFLNTLSKLYLWFEEWIVYRTLKQDKIRSGIEIVKHYNRNGQYKLADSKAKQVQNLIDTNSGYSPQNNFYQYQLYYYQFYSDNTVKDQNPQLVFDMVDSYMKCRTYTDSLMRNQIEYWSLVRVVGPSKLQQIRQSLTLQDQPTLLHHFTKLTTNGGADDLAYCLQELKEKRVKRDDDFFTILTMFLMNMSLQMWHRGTLSSTSQVAEIWEFALDEKVLMNAGKIPFRRFITIVNTLGAFSSYEWMNSFIDKWASFVEDERTTDVVQFAKAANYFHNEQYDESLKLIYRVSTKFIASRSIIHRLVIMLYYETIDQNYAQLIDALHRYEAYVRRRTGRESEHKIRVQRNFIRAIKYLLSGDCTLQGLRTYSPATNTRWLKSKVDEMSQPTS